MFQVTNCYAIPFRDRDTPEINDNFNRLMWNASKRSSPSEQIVGWLVLLYVPISTIQT